MKGIFIEKNLIASNAYKSLKKPQSHNFLIQFMQKRRLERNGKKKGHERWIVTNNGQIEFTYEEAKKELGIDKKTFTRAIDELILKGFIDIVHQGGGLCRGKNLYSISDRWQLYGTDKFIEKHREKRKRIYGYIDKKL